jgi:hypothetical protein
MPETDHSTENPDFTVLEQQTQKPAGYKNTQTSTATNIDPVSESDSDSDEMCDTFQDLEIKGDISCEKYIIIYNNQPLYIVDTIEEAEKFSLTYTKQYYRKTNLFEEHYRTEIIMKTNGFEIVRYNPFFNLFYDQVIMSISYIKVKQFKHV